MEETRTIQEKVILSGELTSQDPAGDRQEYRCRFIRAGQVRGAGNRPGNLVVDPAALEMAVGTGLFEQRAVFVDHSGWLEYPSLEKLAGVTFGAEWDSQAQEVTGVIRLYSTPFGTAVAELLDEIISEGEARPDVGLSIVFWPVYAPRDNDDDPLRVASIRHVESVDLVFEPAAEGRILEKLSAAAQKVDNRLPADSKSNALGGANIMAENENNEVTSAAEQTAPAGETPSGENGAAWLSAMEKAGAQAIIQVSGLPAASRERLAARQYESPDQVTAAVEAERAYLARLEEDQVIRLSGPAPRGGSISVGRSGIEQLSAALDALLAGTRPEGVAPLTGIREAYMHLSGDYEMTGLFYPERVTLANVTSATMAGLVANALNKRVVALFQEYPHWWERICSIEDFTTMQQVKWITLGGVGDLPTVAEGAAYTELTWADKTETADFVKKGGYLGLTIEAIDKDDTRKLQAAPRALAQAAWMTLGKAVSGIFTANAGTGPVMADGKALFHADHGNLGATTLTWAGYVGARMAMRKQTELNSGNRLGALTAPRYLLVPPDLEITALQVLATEQTPGGADNDENPLAEGDFHDARMNAARERVVVVDVWDDANNWAAVADPRKYPSIGLGFRYGRAPEIFSVASPTAGLMFTNDVMPVKVRFIFAAGPMDYRGMYKSNPV